MTIQARNSPKQWIAQADIHQFTSLTHDRWVKAYERARQIVRTSQSMPVLEYYIQSNHHHYPRWLVTSIAVALGVLALGALFVSAGKQIAAADIVLSNVAEHSERIGQAWVSISLIVLLLVGEIGALVFAVASAIFGRTKISRLVFRAFMFASSLVAILANVSMTYVYRVTHLELFQWFVTIFAPCVVLGVGFVGENILLTYLEQRADAITRWKKDFEHYQLIQREPEKHESWARNLAVCILQELQSSQTGQLRKQFKELLNTDPSFRERIVLREMELHLSSYGSVEEFLTRPTIPPLNHQI